MIRAFISRWWNTCLARTLFAAIIAGTVGEPINLESWMWYYHVIGSDQASNCGYLRQTETGGIMTHHYCAIFMKPVLLPQPLPWDSSGRCRFVRQTPVADNVMAAIW